MRRKWLAAVGMVMALAAAPQAQDAEVRAARQAADTWLALVDAGNYASSWDIAAIVFKDAVTADEWAASAGRVRNPLGAVQSREVRSDRRMSTLPGVPDGDYVLFEFDTAFANKAAAVETVVFAREADGLWRASGYFVR